MRSAKQTLDEMFPEMRWRCLSLAADLDRVERSGDGTNVLGNDPRLRSLREAIQILLSAGSNRAERVQLVFSDMSPGPK